MVKLLFYITEAILIGFLIPISVIDIRKFRIGNKWLLAMLPFAVLRAVFAGILSVHNGTIWWKAVLSHFAGGSVMFLLFLLLAICRGGIGGGDIKLAGILGLSLGFSGVFLGFSVGMVFACIYGLVLKAISRVKNPCIQLAPFLSLGAAAGMVLTSLLPIEQLPELFIL